MRYVVSALVLSGCGGDAPARPAAAIDTVNGVERVSYAADPAGALGWGLDTLAVLGDALAEDAYQFDGVSEGGLAADAAGHLYVLDRQGGRILKYDAVGSHLATYGRSGEGPGELSQPVAVTVGPGDTVWVSDFGNSRITGFPQDGGDPRTIALPENAGIPGREIAALPDGFITLFRPLFNFRAGSGSGLQVSRSGTGDEEDDGPPKLPVLRLTRSLEPVDTLWATREPPTDMVQLEALGRVMVAMMAREFYPEFQWRAFRDGGLVVADSAAYVLHLLSPGGDIVRTIARAPAPRPTTEADRELVRERLRQETQGGVTIGGAGLDEAARDRMLEQRLEQMTFADLIPRIVALRVDPDDRIWVGVSESTPDEVDRIDVYDRDGTLLGELRGLPMPDVFLDADRIGVLRRDELDVQQVVILELTGTGQEMAAAG